VDPGLIRSLEYSYRDARADNFSLILFLLGLIAGIPVMTVMIYYSPTIATSNIYPLIMVPFAGVPMLATLVLLAGRFRGKYWSATLKIFWSSLIPAGIVLSLVAYFMISPVSYYWMMGDIDVKKGDLEGGEAYYLKALEIMPDSIDVIYEMGKLYMQKEDWEGAYDYLVQAYEMDPEYWGPAAVVLIPDVLMKMGRYDEAMSWCKKILKDHPQKMDIARAISKKQDEIIWERDRQKRESKGR
jgi:tetratricopeptide (TPR) repeat protein